MSQFALQISEFAKLAKENAGLVVQKAAVDIFGRVVKRTPVDSGRARANWQMTVGSPAGGTVSAEDKAPYGSPPSGALAANAATAVASFEVGPSIFIVNNLPYINRLEFEGWSKQAPAGMVRVTVTEWQNAIDKASAQVKQ